MCYLLISETKKRFHNSDKLSMDRIGCERSELQRFCCKKCISGFDKGGQLKMIESSNCVIMLKN